MLHDVGNERRFLIFIPALVALTALVLGRDRTLLPEEAPAAPIRKALLALPVVLFALYVIGGTLVRLAHLYEIGPNVRRGGGGGAGWEPRLFTRPGRGRRDSLPASRGRHARDCS